jgi:hypothetical protein
MNDGDELKLPGFIAESEVLPPSKNLGLRLLAVLIGLGLLIGIAVAGGAVVLTAVWPKSAGMCDASAGSCSERTVTQIASFSGISLPATTEIGSAQCGRVDHTGLLYEGAEPGYEAASGQRADGRTVILIRVTRTI